MSNDLSLVIGASGLVGRCLMKTLDKSGGAPVGTYANRPSAGLRHLDITDASRVADCISALRPRAIYLTAALTHVDGCEDQPDTARRINVLGPSLVAAAARRVGAKLVFYSTEYIFDGAGGPYDEEAAPNPLSVYGHTKLQAEYAIRDIVKDVLIVRTTVVFGWDRHSKNFAMQIYDRVQTGVEMTIPDDQLGSPTWAGYLAEASVRLTERGASGIVNVAGTDTVCRTEFARALVRIFGGRPEQVIPVLTASLRQKAARPLRGGLRTDKLRAILAEEPLSLVDSLKRLEFEWQRNI